MQTVRRRILEILKRRKSATVSELARHLDMAPVSVRYHLDILQGDNLIEISKVRREGNVGRPKQIYTLTHEADHYFPDNFAPVTAGLVNQMKKALAPEQVANAFCALAQEMAQELSLEGVDEHNVEERLGRVSEFLNDRGYLARWEKIMPTALDGRASYLLHTFNCPYASVSLEHRELCQMDLELIQSLVGQSCQRKGSLAENHHCCTYEMQMPGEDVDVTSKLTEIHLVS